MAESITYNMDCMDFLKTVPDKYYTLAVVDPPFGSGLADNGGCKGWFTKYHRDTELEVPAYNRFGSPGSRFEKYKNTILEETDIGGGVENQSPEQAERGLRNTVKKS